MNRFKKENSSETHKDGLEMYIGTFTSSVLLFIYVFFLHQECSPLSEFRIIDLISLVIGLMTLLGCLWKKNTIAISSIIIIIISFFIFFCYLFIAALKIACSMRS